MSADVVGLDGIVRDAGLPLKDRRIAKALEQLGALNDKGGIRAIVIVAYLPDGTAMHSGCLGENPPVAANVIGGIELAKIRVIEEARALAPPEGPINPEPGPA